MLNENSSTIQPYVLTSSADNNERFYTIQFEDEPSMNLFKKRDKT
jgi:hypothetical protein